MREGVREEVVVTIMMTNVGIYEFNAKDLIGHGAFAVVYKGRLKSVSRGECAKNIWQQSQLRVVYISLSAVEGCPLLFWGWAHL